MANEYDKAMERIGRRNPAMFGERKRLWDSLDEEQTPKHGDGGRDIDYYASNPSGRPWHGGGGFSFTDGTEDEPQGKWLYDERRFESDPKSRTAYEYGVPEEAAEYRAAMERAHLGRHPRRYDPYSGEDYDGYWEDPDKPEWSYEKRNGIDPRRNLERLRNDKSRMSDGRYRR